jgi:hypothetical protein
MGEERFVITLTNVSSPGDPHAKVLRVEEFARLVARHFGLTIVAVREELCAERRARPYQRRA